MMNMNLQFFGGRGGSGNRNTSKELSWTKMRKDRNLPEMEQAYVGDLDLEYPAMWRYREAGDDSYYIDRVYAGKGDAYDRVDKNGNRTLYNTLSGAVRESYSNNIENYRARVQRRTK